MTNAMVMMMFVVIVVVVLGAQHTKTYFEISASSSSTNCDLKLGSDTTEGAAEDAQ